MITIEDLELAGSTPEEIIRIVAIAEARERPKKLRSERNRRYYERLKASEFKRLKTSETSYSDAKEIPPCPLQVSPNDIYNSNPLPNPLPLEKIKKPPLSPVRRESYTVEFEQFWLRYPEKVGKAAAAKAFDMARRRARFDQIMAGLGRYINGKPLDRNWCHPRTWLHQDRWLDQIAPAPVSKAMQHINEFINGSDYDRPRSSQEGTAEIISFLPLR